MKPIRNGLAGLLRFPGRDRRATFWLYALAVVGVCMVLGNVLVAPLVVDVFAGGDLVAFDPATPPPVEPPADGTIMVVEGGFPGLPDFRLFFFVTILTAVATVALLAAAVTRRLHDSGRSGLWGLMPLPFLTASLIGFPIMLSGFGSSAGPDFRLFGLLFVSNLAYMTTLAVLIVLLSLRSTVGPNRFGEEPPE